ncbi:MAG TPA: hypothetical protein VK828_21175 [Terriglobales bacterium]|jgi:hypothetical protein|nr:hypothetical protein [Terriglobales bacterium]
MQKVTMPEKDKSLALREIAPADLEEVAGFIARISGSHTPLSTAVRRLAWILLENPAREPTDPFGWLLRAPSGEIAGCMCCAPQKFCFAQKTFTLMMANSFYVDDRYRGGGASIFLKYLQLGRRYPLFVSSANPTVAEMWQKLGGYPLGNSDHEVIGIQRWSPLLAENIYRQTASHRMAQCMAQFAAAFASPFLRAPRGLRCDTGEGQLLPLHTCEEAAGVCAEHHCDKITNCRDAAFLKWRYFSPVTPTARLFAFRPAADDKKFIIAVQLQNRGYKQQIRALQILDIWGEPAPKSYLSIASALAHEYRERIDMLVFRCLDQTQQQALIAHGFKFRRFAAPIAWCIDKHGLLPSKSWYFVPADGDMFL